MELQKEIEQFKEEAFRGIPEGTLKAMADGIEELRLQKVAQNCLKKGNKAPDFTLPNVRGENVSLYHFLHNGPVVLSFYRGGW